MSAADYFTMNRYEGKIYKTNNMQGKVLANYCKSDSALVKEQKRIEKELSDFEQHIWGHDTDLASDSITDKSKDEAVAEERKTVTTKSRNSRRASTSKKTDDEPKAKSEKKSKSDKSFFSSSSSSSTPRVTVRRQRR